MTKKVITLIGIYFFVGILLFQINSCDLLKFDMTICDIHFSSISNRYVNQEAIDTLTGEIGFIITDIPSSPSCFYLPNAALFNSAMATTKCGDYQNRLITSSYELYFSQNLIIENDTIFANTNALDYPFIKNQTKITCTENCDYIQSYIIFEDDLYNSVTFEEGSYEVSFRCTTSDDRHFNKSTSVYLKK
jgi:hypothetical protein